MPLSQSDLKDALQAVIEAQYDADKAAEEYAKAYYDYAKAGRFVTNVPTLPTAKRDALKATLLAAISNPLLGTPANFAGAWGSGVITFWTGVAVASPSPVQSGTTSTPPSDATGALTLVFANLANTPAICAQGMAAALHTATMATKATVTPPAGTVLNIA